MLLTAFVDLTSGSVQYQESDPRLRARFLGGRGLGAQGLPITGEGLLEIGERIVNLERLYNVREGLGRADDHLPQRFAEPLPLLASEIDAETGTTRLGKQAGVGQLFDFEAMLDRYYHLRGWDADGRPTRLTLQRLELAAEGYDETTATCARS